MKRSLLNKNHIKTQNQALSTKNQELTEIKKQLSADEEEYARTSLPSGVPCVSQIPFIV